MAEVQADLDARRGTQAPKDREGEMTTQHTRETEEEEREITKADVHQPEQMM